MAMLQTVVAFVVALTVLIFVHELGHYLVAQRCGVKILRFSIGFGRPLLSWTVGRDRTEWTIAAIPLGGYVRMLDEREQHDGPIPADELARAFNRQSLVRRTLIVVAGPLANFVLAVALYAVLNAAGVREAAPVVDTPIAGSPAASAGLRLGDDIVAVDGSDVRSWNDVRLGMIDGVLESRPIPIDVERGGARERLTLAPGRLAPSDVENDLLGKLGLRLAPGPVFVANVPAGGAAARAGLRAGDEVLAIDGKPVARSEDLIDTVRANPGRTLRFDVMREGQALRIDVVPDARTAAGPGGQPATIGFIDAAIRHSIRTVEVRYRGFAAVGQSVAQTWEMSAFTLRMLGKMVVGQLTWRNLSGPVTIADYAGQSARIGWKAYVSFLALLSISLGVLNLLPIPVLDGGHLVYYGLEALRGRPLSERFMELSQKAGLAVVGTMMVIALFNDLTRLIGS